VIASCAVVAARSILKDKAASAIAVLGFSIGMAGAILAFLYAKYELSYDEYLPNHERVYRVLVRTVSMQGEEALSAGSPPGIKDALAAEYAGVEAWTQIGPRPAYLRRGGRGFFEDEGFYLADPSLLKVLGYRLVEGDRSGALDKPMSLVLTRSAAAKYFGSEEPMGEVLLFGRDYLGDGEYALTVTGVMEDPPPSSSFRVEFAANIPIDKLKADAVDFYRRSAAPGIDEDAVQVILQTFVLLSKPHFFGQFKECLSRAAARLWPHSEMRYAFKSYGLTCEPLDGIYMFSRASVAGERRGDFALIMALSGLGIAVLAIACINAIGLLTARGISRAREIAARRAVGASRGQIAAQFMAESLMLCFVSLWIALVLVELFLPSFNALVGRSLSLRAALEPASVAALIAVALAAGSISGYFPAARLSSLEVAGIAWAGSGPRAARIKEALIVVQFALSIGLFVAASTVLGEFRFARSRDLGFDPRGVAMIRFASGEGMLPGLKAAFAALPGVTGVSAASFAAWDRGTLVEGWPLIHVENPGASDVMSVDPGYAAVHGLRIVAGRDFPPVGPSREGSPKGGQLLVNEAAAARLGVEPGDFIDEGELRGEVVGIVEDFHYRYPSRKVGPLILTNRSPFMIGTSRNPGPMHVSYMLVKVASADRGAVLRDIERAWKAAMPGFAFEAAFEDEEMARQLDRSDRSFEAALAVSAILSFLLSGLGLFGLASFEMGRRTREIGIRKAMGAGRLRLVGHYLALFLRLVLVANIVAWPAAYLGIGALFSAVGYPRVLSFGVLSFLGAAAASIAVALLAAGYQVMRAAAVPPAVSLRCE
jgi:putative ABC transport system permease protein